MAHTESKTSPRRSAIFNYSYIVLAILLLLTIGATVVYEQNATPLHASLSRWTPVVFLLGLCISLLLFGMTYRDAIARVALERRTKDLLDAQRQNQALLGAEQEARLEAESASRAKDEFLALVSHELRTPLNAIAGWTRILQAPGGSDEARLRALEKIDKNLRIQAEIIEELLNFSDLMSSGLAVITKSIPIREVVEDAIVDATSAAQRKGVALNSTNSLDGELVLGDRRRLKVALANVLTNAVKFTPEGGTVRADAYVAGDSIKCVITDNGAGIPTDFLPHIFEQYKQSEGPISRHYGGLGLGLTMAERIVRLHGGTIEAESRGVGSGATFTISLPIRMGVQVH